jgi:D-alanyl-D-alanine carboxypeptidase
MTKRILLIAGIAVLLVLVVLGWAWVTVRPDAGKFESFIKKHPDKAAIYIVRNDSVIASQNADTIMPLASTVKTLVAIAFARQVADGILKLEEEVDTLEPEKYYLHGTDGNAHRSWLQQMHHDSLLHGSKIKLRDIAKGMIRFSSNANTEYLMDRIGFDYINALRDTFGLTGHHALYPFTSALMVCCKTAGEDPKQFAEKLDRMPMEEYVKKSFEAHRRLKTDPSYKKTFDGGNLYLDIQHIWSNRLPGGSARQYVSLMQKINSRTYFDSTTQIILDAIFEWPMQYRSNREAFRHFGAKGGSTAFVLTQAVYTTDNDNNKTAMAVFFNNLTQLENVQLQSSFDAFILDVMTDVTFRKKLAEQFKP